MQVGFSTKLLRGLYRQGQLLWNPPSWQEEQTSAFWTPSGFHWDVKAVQNLTRQSIRRLDAWSAPTVSVEQEVRTAGSSIATEDTPSSPANLTAPNRAHLDSPQGWLDHSVHISVPPTPPSDDSWDDPSFDPDAWPGMSTNIARAAQKRRYRRSHSSGTSSTLRSPSPGNRFSLWSEENDGALQVPCLDMIRTPPRSPSAPSPPGVEDQDMAPLPIGDLIHEEYLDGQAASTAEVSKADEADSSCLPDIQLPSRGPSPAPPEIPRYKPTPLGQMEDTSPTIGDKVFKEDAFPALGHWARRVEGVARLAAYNAEPKLLPSKVADSATLQTLVKRYNSSTVLFGSLHSSYVVLSSLVVSVIKQVEGIPRRIAELANDIWILKQRMDNFEIVQDRTTNRMRRLEAKNKKLVDANTIFKRRLLAMQKSEKQKPLKPQVTQLQDQVEQLSVLVGSLQPHDPHAAMLDTVSATPTGTVSVTAFGTALGTTTDVDHWSIEPSLHPDAPSNIHEGPEDQPKALTAAQVVEYKQNGGDGEVKEKPDCRLHLHHQAHLLLGIHWGKSGLVSDPGENGLPVGAAPPHTTAEGFVMVSDDKHWRPNWNDSQDSRSKAFRDELLRRVEEVNASIGGTWPKKHMEQVFQTWWNNYARKFRTSTNPAAVAIKQVQDLRERIRSRARDMQAKRRKAYLTGPFAMCAEHFLIDAIVECSPAYPEVKSFEEMRNVITADEFVYYASKQLPGKSRVELLGAFAILRSSWLSPFNLACEIGEILDHYAEIADREKSRGKISLSIARNKGLRFILPMDFSPRHLSSSDPLTSTKSRRPSIPAFMIAEEHRQEVQLIAEISLQDDLDETYPALKSLVGEGGSESLTAAYDEFNGRPQPVKATPEIIIKWLNDSGLAESSTDKALQDGANNQITLIPDAPPPADTIILTPNAMPSAQSVAGKRPPTSTATVGKKHKKRKID